MKTTPEKFVAPYSWNNRFGRMLWLVVYWTLFRPSPPQFGGWRRLLLRLFGARLGQCWLHPSVRVWAPWQLEIGSQVYIDERTRIYNAYGCRIADRVVVSMGTFLCSVSHDYTDPSYRLMGGRITVESDCWLTANVFVGPGVTIGEGAVVGACSVVTRDVPPWTVVAGNPARAIKPRVLKVG